MDGSATQLAQRVTLEKQVAHLASHTQPLLVVVPGPQVVAQVCAPRSEHTERVDLTKNVADLAVDVQRALEVYRDLVIVALHTDDGAQLAEHRPLAAQVADLVVDVQRLLIVRSRRSQAVGNIPHDGSKDIQATRLFLAQSRVSGDR